MTGYLSITKQHYTPSEVGKMLGISRQTVIAMVARGEIPAHTTPGGHHRIPAASFEGVDHSRLLPIKALV